MRLDLDADGHATVRVSIRNLRALIVKASIPGSARTIVSNNCYRGGELIEPPEACTLYLLLRDEAWAAVDEDGVAVCFSLGLAEWLSTGPTETMIDSVRVIVEDDHQHYRGRRPGSMEPRTEANLSEFEDVRKGSADG